MERERVMGSRVWRPEPLNKRRYIGMSDHLSNHFRSSHLPNSSPSSMWVINNSARGVRDTKMLFISLYSNNIGTGKVKEIEREPNHYWYLYLCGNMVLQREIDKIRIAVTSKLLQVLVGSLQSIQIYRYNKNSMYLYIYNQWYCIST